MNIRNDNLDNLDLLMSSKLDLPKYANDIIDAMYASGFECFAVGGFVRDALLGKHPNDCDMCTNAKPDEIKSSLIANMPKSCEISFVSLGEKYGTITAQVYDEDEYSTSPAIFEITTYRVDDSYSDHRKPNNVKFTNSLVEDLKRRDFTMNAIAYNDKVGFVDLFNGLQDIRLGLIRCVGDAKTRFSEDSLRILRALRFSAQLGFDITAQTIDGMYECKEFLTQLSSERIQSELTKILLCGDASIVLDSYKDLIFMIIPQLKVCDGFYQHNVHHKFDVYGHMTKAVDNVGYILNSFDPELIGDEETITKCVLWAALLHDIGKPYCFKLDEAGVGHFPDHAPKSAEIAEAVLDNLKFSTAEADMILTLIRHHCFACIDTTKFCKRMMHKLGIDEFICLCILRKADIGAQAYIEDDNRIDDIDDCLRTIYRIRAEDSLMNKSKLCVDGYTLISLGYKPSQIFSIILDDCIDAINDESLNNNYDEVIKYIMEKYPYN